MRKPKRALLRPAYRLTRYSVFCISIIFCLAVLFLLATGSAQMQQRRIAGPTKTKSSAKLKGARNSAKNNTTRRASPQEPLGQTVGVPWTGERGIQRTTAEIMQAQQVAPRSSRPPLRPEHAIEGREDRPQNPDAQPVASTPDLGMGSESKVGNSVVPAKAMAPSAPQTVGLNFDTVTGPTETGAFPPDTMGAAGPTQFFLFVNGRLRTFNKTTGVADAVVNADPDVFFASVMTPVSPPVVLNFTSDPQVRYDRLSARWFLSIIDVPCTAADCSTTAANRWMVAVSDAASAGTISGPTVWTFYFFQTDATNFCDYPSLGVDSQALYTGCDMFTPAGAFVGTNGYVIRKTSVLSGGPLVQTPFANLAAGIGAGPFAPRGVDNYDPASNEGYFIGVDNATFGTLMIRRVSTPGGTPTISGNLSLAVSTTSFSVPIDHLGNSGGTNGRIDTLDDRLYAAHIRNGRLWTAHNIRVNASGVANTGATSREGVRWYELNGVRGTDNGGVPIVVQSGTIFDSAATLALSRQFSIPTVMVSGQGHAALGFTTTGTPFRIDTATNGRLVGDALGTTQAVALYTTSSTAYNPPGDPGGAGGRRWGDYSFTGLDPLDDMTIWTIQEYCNGTNTYGARVAKLLAPVPATPTTVTTGEVAPGTVPQGRPNYFVTLTGTSSLGSGFYDPGTNLAAPALAFNHVNVTINGAGAPTVNSGSITFVNPTTLTFRINTTAAAIGSYTITVTNPDGQQSTSALPLLTVVGPTAAPATISGRIVTAAGAPLAGVTVRLSGAGSDLTVTDSNGNYDFNNVATINLYTLSPSLPNYHFSPANRSFSLSADKTDAVFTASVDAGVVANAIDTSEYFVRQHYLDFLGREPDHIGFNYWSDQVNQCNGDADCIRTRRIDVSAAFFMSREFQDTGSFVYYLYAGALDRAPAYAEFTPDRGKVVGGTSLERAKTALADEFVNRPEFVSRYPQTLSREQFVDSLLQTIQERSGVNVSSTRDTLISAYNSGGRAAAVRAGVSANAFVQAEYNKAFVLMEYFAYLRRNPDQGGFNFWLKVLNASGGNGDPGNYRGMVCSFITSTEYQRRFSSAVTHSNADCSGIR